MTESENYIKVISMDPSFTMTSYDSEDNLKYTYTINAEEFRLLHPNIEITPFRDMVINFVDGSYVKVIKVIHQVI